MADDWSQAEVEATVADYFAMLQAELRGDQYNKTAHRRALRRLLRSRSDAAVERKHMNISAVLREVGHPWIDGYKPYGNYQHLLADIVTSRLETDAGLVALVRQVSTAPVPEPVVADLTAIWEDPPEAAPVSGTAEAPPPPYGRPRPGGVDYLAIEAQNRSLGSAGEEFVMRVEAERLHRQGHRRLADRIEHVARTRGDGLGYDILSYEPSGRERLVEVKTTGFGKRTPFFVTRGELACSAARSAEYHLYRVFGFRHAPKLFALTGRLDQVCRLEPHQYVGRVA